ncbi:hypothetical protein DAPPUDRAFT_310101 [Daphnia pulex]|uniref:Uncharacterized protein n=1 Tax=Daphnia pulex TaxID=6669 RepID=E9FSF6_DAPPU|nr:hypothetical protein DAPPUDRAFT_310101 [Daphnia pulex]|eukprot:EFX89198.1 hypothetical protein DAPPUDRAFT_310101 [Daphnia pulex]
MPIAGVEETETTEWTHDITTEEAAAATESLTKEEIAADASPDNNNNNNNKGPATITTTTTEEPFNAVTDHDEPTAVWLPSQTVEIRLHPQSLRTQESKGSHQELHPTVAPLASQEFPVGPQAEGTSSTSMPTPSVAPSEDDLFGRRMTMEPQTHGSFGGQTGRLRSRDSVGTALRRAVTGSPAVQRLQQSTTRMASSLPVSTSGRDKAGPPATGLAGSRPGRKIVGFGSLSTLSNAQRVNSKTAAALRKESFFKNRQSDHHGHGHGHGGDTPADTHMEPSPQWLYGTSKGEIVVELQFS